MIPQSFSSQILDSVSRTLRIRRRSQLSDDGNNEGKARATPRRNVLMESTNSTTPSEIEVASMRRRSPSPAPATPGHLYGEVMSPIASSVVRTANKLPVSFTVTSIKEMSYSTDADILTIKGDTHGDFPFPSISPIQDQVLYYKLKFMEATAERDRLADQISGLQTALAEQTHSRSKISQHLECPVCAEPLWKAFSLSPCGHTICLNCLRSWFEALFPSSATQRAQAARRQPLRVNSCPLCRVAVGVPYPAYLVKQIVEELGMPQDEQARSPIPPDMEWGGCFLEELQTCSGCGGLARDGDCLGLAWATDV